MGDFTELEERKYKRFYIIMAVGGVIFLLGLVLIIFGRSYAYDGTKHDLFLVFAVIFMVIGFTVALVPFILQMKMFFGIRKRKEYMDGNRFAGAAGRLAPSAAGQAFSYYPPAMTSPAASTVMDPRYQSQPQQFSAAAMMQSQFTGSQDMLQNKPQSTYTPLNKSATGPGFPSVPQHPPPSHYNTGYSSQI